MNCARHAQRISATFGSPFRCARSGAGNIRPHTPTERERQTDRQTRKRPTDTLNLNTHWRQANGERERDKYTRANAHEHEDKFKHPTYPLQFLADFPQVLRTFPLFVALGELLQPQAQRAYKATGGGPSYRSETYHARRKHTHETNQFSLLFREGVEVGTISIVTHHLVIVRPHEFTLV